MPTTVAGAWIAGLASAVPALPAGLQAGDILVLLVYAKPVVTPTVNQSEWTALAPTLTNGGFEAQGADTGPIGLTVFTRTWASGMVAPTVSVTGGSPTMAMIYAVRMTAGEAATPGRAVKLHDWGPHRNAGAATAYNQQTLLPDGSAVATHTFKVDDLFVGSIGLAGNATISAQTFTLGAGTKGATTVLTPNLDTTTGNDGAASVWSALCTGGSATPTSVRATTTHSVAETGGGHVLIWRTTAPPPGAVTGLTSSGNPGTKLPDQVVATWTAPVGGEPVDHYELEYYDSLTATTYVRSTTATTYTFDANRGDYFSPESNGDSWVSYTVYAVNADGVRSTGTNSLGIAAVGPPPDIKIVESTNPTVQHFLRKSYPATYEYWLDGVKLFERATAAVVFPETLATGLAPGSAHIFKMRAVKNGQFSAFSADIPFTAQVLAVVQPVIPGAHPLSDTPTTDPSFVIYQPSGADVGSLVDTPYLATPGTEYLEVRHESGTSKNIYVAGPLVDDVIAADKYLDMNRMAKLAVYLEVVLGTLGTTFTQFGTMLADLTGGEGSWTDLQLVHTNANAGVWTEDTQDPVWIQADDDIRGRRFYWKFILQASPNNSAASNSLIVRLRGLAAVIPLRDFINISDMVVTASTDRAGEILYTLTPPSDPEFAGIQLYDTTRTPPSPGVLGYNMTYLHSGSRTYVYIRQPYEWTPNEIVGYPSMEGSQTGPSVDVPNGTPLPSAPGVTLHRYGAGALMVRWSLINGLTHYRTRVWRGHSNAPTSGMTQVADLAPGVTEWLDASLVTGVTYKYALQSYYEPMALAGPIGSGVFGGGASSRKVQRLARLLPLARLAFSGEFPEGDPLPENIDDGYLTDDTSTKVVMRTTPVLGALATDSFVSFSLTDRLAAELLDTTDLPKLWISMIPPHSTTTFTGSPTQYSHAMTAVPFIELWQGTPGTGTLVARRNNPAGWVSGLLLTTPWWVRTVVDLTAAERALITDIDALTLALRLVHEVGESFTDLPNQTLPAGIGAVTLRQGNGTATAKNATVSAGALVLASSSFSTDGSFLRITHPHGRASKRLRAKWTGGVRDFHLGMVFQSNGTTSAANNVFDGVFVRIVSATQTIVMDRQPNQSDITALNLTTENNQPGDVFEAVFHYDEATGVHVEVYQNNVLRGTSTKMARLSGGVSRLREFPQLKNESNTGTNSFAYFYAGPRDAETLTVYDVGYGIPTYDPAEATPTSSDSGVVAEAASYVVAVNKADSDAASTTEETSLLTSLTGTLVPDAILAASGFPAGPVTNIQDDPAASDSQVLSSGTGAGDLRASFQNPAGIRLAGEQKFRLRVREP